MPPKIFTTLKPVFEGMEIAAGESAMVEFSLGVDSATVPDSAWDAGNDWSTQHLTNTASKTRYIAGL